MRRFLRLGGTLLLLGLVAGGLLLARLRTGPGLPTGERTLVGLDGPVEVLWDSLAIPQLWATTPRDALFAQGYLHGTHRLWQVEMFRRVARGRLSELFGEATLETDRFLRTLGMDRAAEAGIPLLDPEARRLLEGYLAGLNAAVADRPRLLPPEFLVLGARPEPFTLGDVLALEKIMAWDLADYQRSLNLAQARARLGEADFSRVAPRYPEGAVTILESAGVEDGDAVPGVGAPVTGTSGGEAVPVPDAPGPTGVAVRDETGVLPAFLPDPDRVALLASARRPAPGGFGFVDALGTVRASNAWVVGPERSASGKPLVANDMHLSLDQPTLWYLVGLHAPGLEVVGMSLPGTAGVVAGRTAGVAWGFTNAAVDDVELYLERVDPSDPTRYLTPDGTAAFESRVEVIRVRGRPDDTLRVRSTRHGPVISEVEPRAGGELLSLRWVALDPSTTASALLRMNRAGTAGEFLAALEGFSDPHQNVVFADTAGEWGYWMAGRIPDRPGGVPPLGPVPSWTGAFDWQGYLPFHQHPHALRPPSGLVATANNRQTRGPVGDRINAGGWEEPWRAERITELLRGRRDHDVESMRTLQLDVVSLPGLRYREVAARAFRAAGAPEAAMEVEAWDGAATLESRGATLFHAWWDAVRMELRRQRWDGEDGYLGYIHLLEALDAGLPEATLARTGAVALEGPDGPWGEVHRLTLDHPLAQLGILRTLLGFGIRDLPREGTPHTVNVASYQRTGEGWRVRSGPSQRHVADLADLDAGGFILPGGQSGHPGGRHARDQLARWRSGGLVPLPMSRAGAEARTVARLRLVPPGG